LGKGPQLIGGAMQENESQDKPPSAARRFLSSARALFARLRGWLLLFPTAGALAATLAYKAISPHPTVYEIYVVGDFTDQHDPGSPIADKLLSHLRGEPLPPLAGTPVQVKFLNDDGDPVKAEQAAQQIATKEPSILVIGHISSTPTKKALPVYLIQTEPPIPVILVTETNPDLLPPLPPSDYPLFPILRLSPPDNMQAETAADFAATKASTFWVIEDGDNPVYSHFLAKEFIRKVQKKPGKRVMVWSTSMNIPATTELQHLGIDGIFFVGKSDTALILIRQLSQVYSGQGKMPAVFLTDSAVADLIQQIDREGGAEKLDSVYVFNRQNADLFNKKGFSDIVRTAGAIVRCVLQQSNDNFDSIARKRSFTYPYRRLLGLDTMADARNVVDATFVRLASGESVCDLEGCEQCGFDRYYWRNARVHIWGIQPKEGTQRDHVSKYDFVELPSTPNDSESEDK
jgi:hypothetical protein